MPQGIINFGAGRIVLVDGTNTPREVGEATEISLDHSYETKKLKGGKTFPIATAITGQSLSGKIASATVYGKLINAILGATMTTGSKALAVESTSSASFTVANGATYAVDLGVVDASNNPMEKVASAPTVGQYTVNVGTGAYTFNAGQVGARSISYQYSMAGTGSTMTGSNGVPRVAPTFKLVVYEEFDGKKHGYELMSVTFPKLGLAFKSEDFTVSNLEFDCQADSTGVVYKIYENQ